MNLRKYLRINDIKLKEMAETLGISFSYLNSIIYAGKIPSPKISKKIHEVTKGQVTEEDFYPHHKCPHCGHDFIDK